MVRTTIMADEQLLASLRRVAREQGLSLGEVIRQGMEMRARLDRTPLTFVGSVRSSHKPHNTARDSTDAPFAPDTWR